MCYSHSMLVFFLRLINAEILTEVPHFHTPNGLHPWWPSWLDCGALINVDPQDVLRRWGTSSKVFILWYSCTQRFPRRKCQLLVAYTSHSAAS